MSQIDDKFKVKNQGLSAIGGFAHNVYLSMSFSAIIIGIKNELKCFKQIATFHHKFTWNKIYLQQLYHSITTNRVNKQMILRTSVEQYAEPKSIHSFYP